MISGVQQTEGMTLILSTSSSVITHIISNKLALKALLGEALEQVAQECCECPIPRSLQGQAGWGHGQPDLMGGIPAHGGGVGTV